jgi:phenylacetate-coenzyme A ligase PaaK-like adenylate-forming protein
MTLASLRVHPGAIRHAQTERLRAQLDLLSHRHPRYRSLWRSIGVDVADIRTIDDLEVLPLTTKRQFAADPEAFRLEPEAGDLLWDVVYTTGSTGAPTPVYQTAHDFRTVMMSQRRMGEIRGLGPRDRIANLFPVAGHPHGSWVRVTNAAQAVGAQLVTGMSGARTSDFSMTRRTDAVAALLVATEPSVLWGVGSYLRRLLEHLTREGHRLTTVRMVVCSGEGLSVPAERHIVELLGELGSPDAVVSRGFGASELQCSLVPCEPGATLHNPAPELHLLQVVDVDGRVLPSGTPGRLCVTHLDRRGTALVRYLLGDLVTLTDEPCPRCGRAGGSLVAHHGRVDGMVKIRGNLVDPERLAAAVDAVAGVREHRATLQTGTEELSDELVVEVAASTGVDEAGLVRVVADEVWKAVGVRATVRHRPVHDLLPHEAEVKHRRFVVATRQAGEDRAGTVPGASAEDGLR